MASTTAADVLIDALQDWGVDTIFGLPGDGINGIMEALRTRKEKIRFIQVRHEEAASFMACAYAKYTGKLGVCLGTSGPGGIHPPLLVARGKMTGRHRSSAAAGFRTCRACLSANQSERSRARGNFHPTGLRSVRSEAESCSRLPDIAER